MLGQGSSKKRRVEGVSGSDVVHLPARFFNVDV